MNNLLNNPVYNALLTGEKHRCIGNDEVKFFDYEVSPFAGFKHDYKKGFSDLYEILPSSRKILYATPTPIKQPPGWMVQQEIRGLQFIFEKGERFKNEFPSIIQLNEMYVDEMVQLAKLTKPGPFGKRTIEFGSYYGIFANGKLVAMTGQRLHVEKFSEISAVCTHPDHLGKGFAYNLIQHQVQLILKNEQLPFLHVREDNQRAISIYQRLGFKVSRPMFFYFMEKLNL